MRNIWISPKDVMLILRRRKKKHSFQVPQNNHYHLQQGSRFYGWMCCRHQSFPQTIDQLVVRSVCPLYSFIPSALSSFTATGCHPPNMNLLSSQSQGEQRKLLTAVFEVNEKAEPFFGASERRSRVQNGQEETSVMVLTLWSGEHEGVWGQNPLSAAQARILCLRSI